MSHTVRVTLILTFLNIFYLENVALVSVQLLALILGEAHSETTTRLYNQSSNRFGGKEGFIQIYDQGNNTWSFVNTSDWNYSDAVVACRELGMHYCAPNRFTLMKVSF